MKEIDTQDNNIEQSQESTEVPPQVSRDDLAAVHDLAAPLIAELGKLPNGDLVGEIIANALKLLRDETNRGDIKLIDKSFKELRYALKVFAPYRDVPKVTIFGSARTLPDDPLYLQTRDLAAALAGAGWIVVTGAGPGIMAAGAEGAGPEHSIGVNIRAWAGSVSTAKNAFLCASALSQRKPLEA